MRARVWLALAAVYVAWGSTYLAIRFAVESIPPFLMAGTRFLVSALILFVWRGASDDPSPTPKQWRGALIVGLLLLLGGNGLVSWAEQSVPSGIAALIVASVPFWIVLIDGVRPGGPRPDARVMWGVLLGFAGIALLVASGPRLGSPEHISSLGVAALLLASILWSGGSVYSHTADLPESSLLGTSIQMFGGAAGLFLAATFAGEWQALRLATISSRSALALLYLIAVGSLIGFVCYAWLLRNAPLSLVSTYAYVNPVVAILIGAWLANEVLNARILIAAGVIVGSVVLITTSRQSRIAPESRARARAAE